MKFSNNLTHSSYTKYNTHKNILNSNITFSEYADNWLINHNPSLNKEDLSIIITNINIGKYYFGSKCLKDITSYDYQKFINNYSLGRSKSCVEQANTIIQTLLKSAINVYKSIPILKI